jgi:hypothetical protein
MRQTREAITQNLAERLCWEAVRRDDLRIARLLYRKQVIDGIYRLDEGAVLDEFFRFLEELGVLERMARVRSTAIEREMVPVVQYILLYGLKTLFGIASMNALKRPKGSWAGIKTRGGCGRAATAMPRP